MSKPTPGPWKLIDHDEDYIAITDQFQDEGVCQVRGTYKRETLEANARLIAAAPELLHALKTLRNETRGTLSAHELAIRYDSGNSNFNCLEMALNMANAALDKVEGRQ